VLKHFSKLYEAKRELALLEWAYLMIVIGSVFVAGMVALFNQPLGVTILIVPLVAFIAMSVNIVAWALIKLAADTVLPKKIQKEDKPNKATQAKNN